MRDRRKGSGDFFTFDVWQGVQDSAVVTALRCYSSKDDFEDSGNMLYIYINIDIEFLLVVGDGCGANCNTVTSETGRRGGNAAGQKIRVGFVDRNGRVLSLHREKWRKGSQMYLPATQNDSFQPAKA